MTRKTYTAPRLFTYGTVAFLTRNAGPGQADCPSGNCSIGGCDCSYSP